MEILRTREELTKLAGLRDDQKLVLVPTMGALHEGHLSLVRLAESYGQVVVSIFVNPTQFGPDEDLETYPRDLSSDLALLAPLGVTAVFAPDVVTMYGGDGEVTVTPGDRALGLCGSTRPHHFGGVLTVLAKLFGLIQPDLAIFGRKDAQQCLVIDQMVQDLCMPIKLIDAPTVREPDGLAMSSRNRYLQGEHRQRALCLQSALQSAQRLIGEGQRETAELEQVMREELAVADRLDYAAIHRVPDLSRVDRISGRTLLAVAAQVGPTRLIDNMVLEVAEDGVTEAGLLASSLFA